MRVVNSAGVIRTFAGQCGTAGYLDAASATAALLNKPTSVAFDGGLFISEQGNQVIRYVSAAGTLSTVAGSAGTSGTTGDGGVATSALLNNPSINPDGQGGYLIADTWNNVVRRLTLQTPSPSRTASLAAGASPSPSALPLRPFVITRVAGTALTAGFAGDGEGLPLPLRSTCSSPASLPLVVPVLQAGPRRALGSTLCACPAGMAQGTCSS